MSYLFLVIALVYGVFLFKSVKGFKLVFNVKVAILGLVTNFFDFFGVGSFAPQTIFLTKRIKKQELYLIPGTLNVANYLPIVFQAFVAVEIIEVEIFTLFLLPIMAFFGGFVGSKYIKIENTRVIRFVMIIALLVSGFLLIFNALNLGPFASIDSSLYGLSGSKLIGAMVIYFGLGFLQSFGIGLYAPGFALLGLFGLNHLAIMPINMISSIFLSSGNSITFLRNRSYLSSEVVLITIFGVIGVGFASFVASVIDLSSIVILLQLIVAVVVIFTAIKFSLEKI